MIADSVKGTTTGNLLWLMSLEGCSATLEAVVRTSDGMYLGQAAGDLGYNHFLGQPSAPTDYVRRANVKRWASLSESERIAVQALAANPPDGTPIPLADFGVPV